MLTDATATPGSKSVFRHTQPGRTACCSSSPAWLSKRKRERTLSDCTRMEVMLFIWIKKKNYAMRELCGCTQSLGHQT